MYNQFQGHNELIIRGSRFESCWAHDAFPCPSPISAHPPGRRAVIDMNLTCRLRSAAGQELPFALLVLVKPITT